ncbi:MULTISPECIES: serine/threonine-protein kinase [Thermus]|uniref:Serine/threonine protein kinase n=1 Tax=Thermus brockianus TaxID=56956 RepID=A0A1J0LTF9_THEBO|nr:serine/threonine-protein kinase [Thermus brockianus]APD09386.1 serine/threonine protein kinase [Thermus brockianus]
MRGVSLTGKVLLEKYRVIRLLGQGALASVFLAFDRFGTPYALKVFPKGAEARRDRELWVGQRLSHPNINPVLEALDLEEGPALLLAYAPGEEMGRWMLRRPERKRALLVFRQLLSALAHMHERGLVHRDVKPENIIVAGTDEARLVDFDLSGPALEAFKKPLRVGTLPYLAPEQVLGQSPGPEADVYAAGVILYWILAGEHPFVGAPEEVLWGHLKGAIPPIPGLEPEQEAFLGRLLAKQPAKRFPTAKEALEVFPF